MPEENKTPDTRGLAWERQERAATICRDAYGGPLTMRDRGKQYLPQFPRESDSAYKDRLSTSVFYDAFARTADGLTGMVFRKPPQLSSDVPIPIQELWENIDGQGGHGEVFLKDRHRDGEVDGHFVIFVDMQRAPGADTLDDERRAGLRPYWVGIRKQDVIGFQTEVLGGVSRITHFRYRETGVESDGGYGEVEVERVREYNLLTDEEGAGHVEFIVWALRRTEGEDQWVAEDRGAMSIDEIPVAVGYHGERRGVLESEPPHLSLALENIKHYQLVSDNDHVLHVASVPLLAIFGADPDDVQEVGPNSAFRFAQPDAKMQYVEPQGNGLDAMERRIQKSEYRMAILGLSTLMSESRAPETATSKRINKAEADSALSAHARATQDAAEEAIRLTAKWLGLEDQMPDRGDVRWVNVNNDFENLPIDAQTITAIANLVSIGKLTQETMWEILKRGEILPEDFDPEREAELLEGAGVDLAGLLG